VADVEAGVLDVLDSAGSSLLPHATAMGAMASAAAMPTTAEYRRAERRVG
jgi:hypothetical protein